MSNAESPIFRLLFGISRLVTGKLYPFFDV